MNDALMYAAITNMLSDAEFQEYAGQRTDYTAGELKNYYTKTLLPDTTIKKARCLSTHQALNGDLRIKVRLPIPSNLTEAEKANVNHDYGYYEKSVIIPKSIHSDSKYIKYTPCFNGDCDECDNFMKAYCQNMIADFKKLEGVSDDDDFDNVKFLKYRPECACLAPEAKWLANSGFAGQYPSICIKPGCGSDISYIDKGSRGKSCNITICNSTQTFKDIGAGGGIDITAKVKQICGGKQPGNGKPSDDGNGKPSDDGNGNGKPSDDGNGKTNWWMIGGGITSGILSLCSIILLIIIAIIAL